MGVTSKNDIDNIIDRFLPQQPSRPPKLPLFPDRHCNGFMPTDEDRVSTSELFRCRMGNFPLLTKQQYNSSPRVFCVNFSSNDWPVRDTRCFLSNIQRLCPSYPSVRH